MDTKIAGSQVTRTGRIRRHRSVLVLVVILLILTSILSIMITRSACTGNWLDKTFSLSHGCSDASVSNLVYADNKLYFKDGLAPPKLLISHL